MADERVKRRLAAIAVADVVGYSRMMETDEAGTLAALKERRKVILEPIVRRPRRADRQAYGRRRADGVHQRGERGRGCSRTTGQNGGGQPIRHRAPPHIACVSASIWATSSVRARTSMATA